MSSFTYTKDLTADPDRLWAILADFGDVSWIPVAGEATVEGSGVGMRRLIAGSGPDPVVERLVSIDPAGRSLVYSIDANGPFPVTRYEATAAVAPAASGATITWTVDFDAAPGDVDEACAGMDMVYGLMAEWLETAASA